MDLPKNVMAAQTDLVEPLAKFFPRLVKMAPAGEPPDEPKVRRASSNFLLWVSLGVFALALAIFVGLRLSFDQQVADVTSRVDKLAH